MRVGVFVNGSVGVRVGVLLEVAVAVAGNAVKVGEGVTVAVGTGLEVGVEVAGGAPTSRGVDEKGEQVIQGADDIVLDRSGELPLLTCRKRPRMKSLRCTTHLIIGYRGLEITSTRRTFAYVNARIVMVSQPSVIAACRM